MKGVLLRSAAEPANTPLVEPARLWHLCWRGGFWWERNRDRLASKNKERRSTTKAEVLDRLLPAREAKPIGCGKLAWVRDTADGKQSAKRGDSTNAGYSKQSGLHAAEAVGS